MNFIRPLFRPTPSPSVARGLRRCATASRCAHGSVPLAPFFSAYAHALRRVVGFASGRRRPRFSLTPRPPCRRTRSAPVLVAQQEAQTLKEDIPMLKAQIQAVSDRNDFIEDCIAEMATVVYADEK